MSLVIDPFFFDSTRDVKNISDGFLKKNGLNYFQYVSVYNDNTSLFLMTHPEFAKARFDNKKRILSHFEAEQINDRLFMFLWNESLPTSDTDMAREYGIDNGLCFVERFSDHYNLIAFATPVGSQINNFYLNNKEKLWGFVQGFKENASSLLQKSNEKKFVVPTIHQDENRDELFLNKKISFQTTYQGIHISLSDMEYKCLKLSASGFTMKGISEHLEISSRTVETYLNRVKSKSGLMTKQDLAEFFHKTGFSWFLEGLPKTKQQNL